MMEMCFNMRRVSKKTIIVSLLPVMLLLSCLPMSLSASGTADPKVFTMGLKDAVASANPFIGIYESDYLLCSYIYDYLMYPNEDGNATPNLAKSWWHMDGATAVSLADPTTSADLLYRAPSEWPQGSIWEYNLTENVNWSDGEPFDADDVVYTVQLQTGDYYATFWAYQPYTKWIDHIQKVDQYAVRLFFTDRTNGSNPAVPISWGDSLHFPIMPEHLLSLHSPVEIAQNWTGIPAIGTGPFMGTADIVSEIISKDKITLVPNPEHAKGLGRIYNRVCEIDQLIMKFYSEEQTLYLDLKGGVIDCAALTPLNYLALQGASDKPPQLRFTNTFSLTSYSKISHFNFEISKAPGGLNPARSDPALHRACALATDRSYIASEIFRGFAVPGSGIISPASKDWYYDPSLDTKQSWFNVTSGTGSTLYSYHTTAAHVMDFDIERANTILNASGYEWPTFPDGYRKVGMVAAERLVAMGKAGSTYSAMNDKNGNPRYLSFDDIYGQEAFDEQDISKYLEAEWKKIGVELVPTAVNTATWYKVVYGFQEHFTETYWSGDPDPNYLLYAPSSYAMDGWNEWGTPDPYYDYCYEMQAHSMDRSDRMSWAKDCGKYLYLSGAASMCTVFPKTCYAFNDGVRWTNWGDWEKHPGLAMDHCWGETPLLFKIKYGSPTMIPPKTSINTQGPSGWNNWYGSQIEIAIGSGDAGQGVDHVLYVISKIDENKVTPILSGNYAAPILTHFAGGRYVLNYTPYDFFGNPGATLQIFFGIDDGPPELELMQVNGTSFDSGTATLSWLAADNISGVAMVEFSLDGSEFSSIGADAVSQTMVGLANGEHHAIIRVTDNAGLSVEKEISFTVSSQASPSDDTLWTLILIGEIVVILQVVVIGHLIIRRNRGTPKQ